MRENQFRVLCTHPFGYPVSEWDIEALHNGFTVVFHAEDQALDTGPEGLARLAESYGTAVAIRHRDMNSALTGLKCTHIITSSELNESLSAGGPLIRECLSPEEISEADSFNCSGVIIRGSESGGKGSTLNNFVFLQAALELTRLPVYVQGGISRYALAGLYACGARGALLSEQLLLFPESPLSPDKRKMILSMTRDETESIGFGEDSFRFHLGLHGSASAELLDLASVSPHDIQNFINTSVEHSIEFLGDPEKVLTLGTDIRFAQRFLDEFGSFRGLARGLRSLYSQVRESLGRHKPFVKGSRFCRKHGIEYPFFQGPMVNITESPVFADVIRKEGGMPFIAAGTLPDRATREIVDQYRSRSDNPVLALGLMGMLGIMDTEGFTRTETVLESKPDYILLGGGDPEYALRLEEKGIRVYIHTPSPGFMKKSLEKGIRRIILEGNEAGGHIAPSSSFILWQEALYILEHQGESSGEISAVFAGGITRGTGIRFLSGMVSLLRNRNIIWGVQAGTALLATDEAVSTGALDERYRKKILAESRTEVVCRRLGRPQRMAPSPKTGQIHAWEREGILGRRSFSEMKREFEENVNRGALRMAARDEIFNPESLNDENISSFSVSGDPDLYEGEAGFLCGQNICMFDSPITVRDLFTELFTVSERELDEFTGESSGERSSHLPESEDIAVVGVGARFPDAASAEEYWEHILSGKNSVREVPPERWDPKYYWDPDRTSPNKTYSRIGTFADLSDFNPVDFGILPNAADDIPDVQKAALLAVRDAFRSSGFSDTGFNPEKTGVFMGTSIAAGPISEFAPQTEKDRILDILKNSETLKNLGSDTSAALLEDFRDRIEDAYRDVNEDTNPGILSNIVSGRIAHSFDLHGPNYTADAACASSLAALLNAVRALQSRQVDTAVAGGADFSNDALTYITFAKVGALSAHMSCPFDARANGFVMGEGAGALILKRLGDAQRDGDRIYAVIRGIGSSSDGSAKGITAPNSKGQRKALERAYTDAGISPSTIGLYEAHGTSTPAGDAAEVSNASEFYSCFTGAKKSIPIGSVKSQIGHTKAAAGIAGLIKCIFSLHRRIIPPTLNVKNINPKLNLEEGPFYISRTPEHWIDKGFPRRAVCSSMGFGGTNFHVVLEEYNAGNAVSDDVNIETSGILFLSGIENETGILKKELGEKLCFRPWLYKKYSDPQNIPQKAAAFSTRGELERILNSPAGISERTEQDVSTCFVFPGQGSQFPGMGSHLTALFPEFKRISEEADDITTDILGIPITRLINISPEDHEGVNRLKQTRYCQPALVYTSYLCFRTAQLLGVEPDVCIGHSLGELSALCCAGYLSFGDVIRTACARAEAVERCASDDPGSMAAVFASEEQVREVLESVDEYLTIANYNSPQQHVISGSTKGVEQAVKLFEKSGRRSVVLRVSNAFHSDMIRPAAEEFRTFLDSVDFRKASVPVYSNLQDRVYPMNGDSEVIRDMLSLQLVSPVHFISQVKKTAENGTGIYLTAGPGGAFSRLIQKNTGEKTLCIDMLRDRNTPVYDPIARLFNAGVPIDIERAVRPMKAWAVPDTDLPSVRKQPEAQWFENTPEGIDYAKKISVNTGKEKRNLETVKGETMKTEESSTLSEIEQYICSLNDPVLTNLLHSPGFREFVNNEKTGIRMVVKQTLLEMFQNHSAEDRVFRGRPDIPADIPEPIRRQPRYTSPAEVPEISREEFINLDRIRQPLIQKPAETRVSASERMEEKQFPEPAAETPDVKETLIDVIMEKTGYSRDMIRDDAEFESELRIDSIKQTEIIGMLGERLGITPEAASGIRADRYTVTAVSEMAQQLLNQHSAS